MDSELSKFSLLTLSGSPCSPEIQDSGNLNKNPGLKERFKYFKFMLNIKFTRESS